MLGTRDGVGHVISKLMLGEECGKHGVEVSHVVVLTDLIGCRRFCGLLSHLDGGMVDGWRDICGRV